MADDMVRQSATSDAALDMALPPPSASGAFAWDSSSRLHLNQNGPSSADAHRPSSAGQEGGLRSQSARPTADGDDALPMGSIPAPAPIYASADPPGPEAWQLPGNPPTRGSQAPARGSQRPPSGSHVVSMAEQRRRQQQQQQQQGGESSAQLVAGRSSAPSSNQKAGLQNGKPLNPLAASLDLSPLGNGAAAGGWAGTL